MLSVMLLVFTVQVCVVFMCCGRAGESVFESPARLDDK